MFNILSDWSDSFTWFLQQISQLNLIRSTVPKHSYIFHKKWLSLRKKESEIKWAHPFLKNSTILTTPGKLCNSIPHPVKLLNFLRQEQEVPEASVFSERWYVFMNKSACLVKKPKQTLLSVTSGYEKWMILASSWP